MDAVVLNRCIPACENIEKTSENEFFANVNVKFGFVPIKFNVRVNLTYADEPRNYRLKAQAEGGLADAAKATGDVEFIEVSEQTTRVKFLGQLMPGSKLFELGEPLIQQTAGKWFKRFFQRFEKVILEKDDRS